MKLVPKVSLHKDARGCTLILNQESQANGHANNGTITLEVQMRPNLA